MFEEARKAALPKDRRDYWFGAVGIRKDGTIVSARNVLSYNKEVRAHAECRCARKGAKEIWVVRISQTDGRYLDSFPCNKCLRFMRVWGVKKVHYIKDNKRLTLVVAS